MSLSMDLKIRGSYGSAAAVSGPALTASNGRSFSQVFSAACQAGGGTDHERYFQLASETYQVPVDLIKAVARAESNFNANAVSRCGAQGVMQLMPNTARAMGVTDSFDPAQNIMGGTKYLRQMLDTFDGDVSKAIAAYNAGPNTIKKYGGVLPSQEGYVNKVLEYAGGSVLSGTVGGGATVSDGLLTQDDLADLVFQAYGASGAYSQEYVRMLMRQIVMENAEENEGQERNRGV